MRHTTTFKRWNSEGGTASWKDFFDYSIVRQKRFEDKEGHHRSLCTFKVTIGKDAPEVFYSLCDIPRSGVLITGISKLHDGDVDNPLTGQDLAEHKALKKVYKYCSRQFMSVYYTLSKLAADCSVFSTMYTNKALKQQECWKKLSGIE